MTAAFLRSVFGYRLRLTIEDGAAPPSFMCSVLFGITLTVMLCIGCALLVPAIVILIGLVAFLTVLDGLSALFAIDTFEEDYETYVPDDEEEEQGDSKDMRLETDEELRARLLDEASKYNPLCPPGCESCAAIMTAVGDDLDECADQADTSRLYVEDV